MEFLEIEHKYLMDDSFASDLFIQELELQKPLRSTCVEVCDTYFTLPHNPLAVLRHRYDEELHQLTLKSFSGSSEVRTEINLDLVRNAGAPDGAVQAFCRALGSNWMGQLHKSVQAYEFETCEVVFYSARARGRQLQCVEFEAVGAGTLDEALTTVGAYARRFGFDPSLRCHQSLFELMFPEQALKLKQSHENSW